MRLVIELDEDDAKAVNKAITVRQNTRLAGQCILPDSDSDTAGTIIGEICRDWLEARGQWEWLPKRG